jgi:F-type H+-transporting ATPase subunit gamma
MVKADRSAYKVFVVGDKGSLALSRALPDLLEFGITNVQTPLNFPTGKSVIII